MKIRDVRTASKAQAVQVVRYNALKATSQEKYCHCDFGEKMTVRKKGLKIWKIKPVIFMIIFCSLMSLPFP